MGLPVTFNGKPVLHKHVSSGENSRVVCSRVLNRTPRFTVQHFISAGLIFPSFRFGFVVVCFFFLNMIFLFSFLI